ncbi:MAG TPA: DUF3501 family protein [Gammaproteobacteria bacterium]|nr:DUF3501 family protein [Gammaproteobacteria bacterium]
MKKLTRADLYSLEKYAEIRADFRARVMAHKKRRTLALGPNATLVFEDRLTIQYQIQEMLRVERIFEAEGIEDELAAYNPLIPDGTNWKATLLIEFPDIEQRRLALKKLKGIEDLIWVRVHGHAPVYAIADEDLERENEEKTSSVHFLRFELAPEMIAALKNGAALAVGCDHAAYKHVVDPIPETVRRALLDDLD